MAVEFDRLDKLDRFAKERLDAIQDWTRLRAEELRKMVVERLTRPVQQVNPPKNPPPDATVDLSAEEKLDRLAVDFVVVPQGPDCYEVRLRSQGEALLRTARALEFGTSKSPPRHFWSKAVSRMRAKFKNPKGG